ncbi:MAG: redoxin domain-containing protein [Micrococcus sp.]|nr:redoxin domain-containing protein [Micrococcus sp.]
MTPALRDAYGQRWEFPPVGASAGVAAHSGESAAGRLFRPGAFTPVCMSELGWVGELAAELVAHDVGVRVVACDPAAVLREVAERVGVGEQVDLLSDFWPHGAACARFDAFDAETGRARRVSVLVAADGAEQARIEAEPGQARTVQRHRELTREWLRRSTR